MHFCPLLLSFEDDFILGRDLFENQILLSLNLLEEKQKVNIIGPGLLVLTF